MLAKIAIGQTRVDVHCSSESRNPKPPDAIQNAAGALQINWVWIS
jgi:hypothetical protein